jgi:glycosyltransferase involved in cell wall biosynthesis
MPRVSVILPVFNGASTIERAIASIRAQTYSDWELLVVNDGSTDATISVAEAASTAEPRIRLLNQPHFGLVTALNLGLQHARGEFIARMDADDECLPERLAAQTDWLLARPELGLVGCLVEFGGDRERNAGYALHVDWINSVVTPEQIALNRFIESPFAHPSVMFRRELIEQHGGYRAGDFPEDYDLWLRWLAAGVGMAKVPRPLLRWNDPPTRLSRTDPCYSPENFFRLKAKAIADELAGRTRSRAVWVWGAGRPTRKRVAFLETHGVLIAGFIDIDPKKTGKQIAGRPVISATSLPAPADAFVLGYVSSRGARALIRSALHTRGYSEGSDFLMCA